MGESVTHRGRFYDVSRFRLGIRLGDTRPKIVIGALGPRMLRLAGEIADGVLLNYLPASHVPWSVERVREGGDATIYAYVHAGVCDRSDGLLGPHVATVLLRRGGLVRGNFTDAGFGDEVAAIRERHAAGDRDGALAAVTERMIDAIDVIGDVATVRDTMERTWGPASTCRCSCRSRGAPTAGTCSRPRSALGGGSHLGVDGFLTHAGPPPRRHTVDHHGGPDAAREVEGAACSRGGATKNRLVTVK